MWNPVTRRVHITRDIIWMKQMLFQKKVDEFEGELPPEVETTLIEADTAHETEREEAEEGDTVVETAGEDEDDEDDEPLRSAQETQWVTATTRAGRVSRLPARYRQEINAVALNSQAGRNYYELLIE